jgi:DNA-binding response OmpR family regulator
VRRRRVLIIDDDAFVGDALTERLQAMGFDATAVHDGPSGLAYLTQGADGHPVRLVLLDLNMPGMDGLAVLREIQARHPEVPVIVMSASPAREGRLQALAGGAFDYMEKPFDGQALMAKIRRAIGSGHE